MPALLFSSAKSMGKPRVQVLDGVAGAGISRWRNKATPACPTSESLQHLPGFAHFSGHQGHASVFYKIKVYEVIQAVPSGGLVARKKRFRFGEFPLIISTSRLHKRGASPSSRTLEAGCDGRSSACGERG
jgi:hypothetical protein